MIGSSRGAWIRRALVLAAVVSAAAIVPAAQASDTLAFDTGPASIDGSYVTVSSWWSQAQTFKATASGPLTHVTVLGNKRGFDGNTGEAADYPWQPLVVDVRPAASDGSSIGSTVRASTSVAPEAVGDTNDARGDTNGTYDVTFAQPAQLVAGQEYALVFSTNTPLWTTDPATGDMLLGWYQFAIGYYGYSDGDWWQYWTSWDSTPLQEVGLHLVLQGYVGAAMDTTPPVVTVPADLTAEATGPDGAPVTFTASATDETDGSLTPTCSPTSGSTFPLGTTEVTCTATDAAGNVGQAGFNVTVQDTTPPTLDLPADLTVDATGPSGAEVSYAATAADLVDGSVPVFCAPASGATFSIGATTVTCSATDAAGNRAEGSFTVVVLGAQAQLQALQATVVGIGPGRSLSGKADTAAADLRTNYVDAAIGALRALAHEARAQAGKTLTRDQAGAIAAAADRIVAVLGG